MNEEELYKLLNIPNKPWIELTDEEIQLFEKNNNYIKQLQQENHTLNKGIDELLKKYEEKMDYEEKEISNNHNSFDHYRIIKNCNEVIYDLKKLKGE